jgi:hypothetical protein
VVQKTDNEEQELCEMQEADRESRVAINGGKNRQVAAARHCIVRRMECDWEFQQRREKVRWEEWRAVSERAAIISEEQNDEPHERLSLSQRHGASSGCGWRNGSDMEGSCP